MNVLILGSGGREHALAWKLRQSPQVTKLLCAPGNPGLAQLADCVPADLSDPAALAALAAQLHADLTVVGPELPLVRGIADEFARRGLKILGPSQQAAELEGSKVFAKEFMRRHRIPTADFQVCPTNGDAYSALCAVEWPCVIKADGLAGGKGVRIADDPDQATDIVEALMERRELGPAGDRVVIEEYLQGEELSFIVLTDGETILPLPPTRDHKRVFDNDRGPNTGGMGAYSDDALLDDALRQQILREIVAPAIQGLAAEGRPYRGFLYCGLMLTADGPKVLEFNCRMGDPECQPLMVRLESDLAELLAQVAAGKLSADTPGALAWSPQPAVTVVLASQGYPGEYQTGHPITGLDEAAAMDGVEIFHAGARLENGRLVTAGGRVLGVTARAPDLPAAVERAYAAVAKINFEGMHYRTDIAARARRGSAHAHHPERETKGGGLPRRG